VLLARQEVPDRATQRVRRSMLAHPRHGTPLAAGAGAKRWAMSLAGAGRSAIAPNNTALVVGLYDSEVTKAVTFGAV